MKNTLVLLLVLLSLFASAQQYRYNPSLGTVSNKPYSLAQSGPSDGRSYLYDSVNFRWRPYTSTAEVLYYLNLPKYRQGNFSIWVNQGGSLSNGIITGGVNKEYLFRDNCTDDACLVLKTAEIPEGKVVVFSDLEDLRNLPNVSDDTSVVYMDSDGNQFRYDPSDESTADDTAMTIVNGDKRLKRVFNRILYPEWFSKGVDIGDNVSNAAPAFNKMFRWMESQVRGSYEVNFLHNTYYISQSVIFPKTIQALPNDSYPYVLISGYGVTIRTDQNIDMFYRMPAVQNDIEPMNNNYKLLVKGIYVQGDRTTVGQTGFRIGLFYGGVLENVHVLGVDTGFVGSFLTKFTINDCFFSVNGSTDIKLKSMADLFPIGVAGSATNATKISNTRFFKNNNSYAAIDEYGTDNTVVEHCIIEGGRPRYGIAFEHQNSSVSNTHIYRDIWFEGNGGNPSVNFKLGGSGLMRIQDIQRTYQDTLFDFSGSLSGTEFLIDGFTYAGNMAAKPFISDAANPNLSGRSIKISNSDISFATMLWDATKWRDGQVPSNMVMDYFQGANLGWSLKTSSDMYFFPRYQVSADFARFIWIGGNLRGLTDNGWAIGDWYGGGSYRPRTVSAGITGMVVDNSARYYFGQFGVTRTDLSLMRDSVGQLGIRDSTTNYMNIKAARGIYTQRTGYNGYFSLNDIGDWDFVSKNMVLSRPSDRIYVEDFGAVGDGVTNDAAAFQSMYDWVAAQTNRTFIIAHGHRTYLINTTVNLPKTLTGGGELRRLKVEGNGVTYTKTSAGPMFSRMASTQAEALNDMIGAYALTIDGVRFVGNQTAGQVALKLSSLYTPVIQNCNFYAFDTAVVAAFWLNARILNNNFSNNISVAFKGASGLDYWSGGTTSNSAFNMPLFSGNRIYNQGGAFAGLALYAADGIIIRDHISEGANPRYDIYDNYQGASVVNGKKLENGWFESTGGTYTTNTSIYTRTQGAWEISNIQNDYPDTLLTIDPTGGQSTFTLRNWNYFNTSATTLFDGGGSLNTNVSMEIKEMPINMVSYFYDNTKWSNNTIGVVLSGVGYNSTNSYGLRTKSTMFLDAGNQALNITAGLTNLFSGGNIRIYNSTDLVNYNRLEIAQQSTSSVFNAAKGGSNGNGLMAFQIAGANKIEMDASNAFFSIGLIPNSDNTYDLGRTSGPLRWRTGYFGTSLGIAISTSPSQALHVGGKVQIDQWDNGTSADSIVVVNNGLLKRVLQSSIGGTNIYNSDGTIPTNRTVTLGSNQLRFGNDASNYMSLAVASGTPTLASTSGFGTLSGIWNMGSTSANFYIPHGSNGAQNVTTSAYLPIGAASLGLRVGIRGNVGGTLVANSAYGSFVIGEETFTEASTGTHPLISQQIIRALNVTGAGATVTDAATLFVEGPSNATVSGFNDAFRVYAGNARFGADVNVVGDIRSYQSGAIYTATGYDRNSGAFQPIVRNNSTGRHELVPASVGVSSNATVGMNFGGDYFATGTTATYTLPTVSADYTGRYYMITLKNRGSGNVTVDVFGGASTIYNTSVVSSIVLTPGEAKRFMCDGTYWNVE